jgi:hypothetical protein
MTAQPGLTGDVAVDADAVADFGRNGQVVLRGIATASEIADIRTAVRAGVAATAKLDLGPGNEVYQRAFDQHMNLWQFEPAVGVVTLSPRFARIAATLLGVGRVRLYHDQALFKRAHGGHTPWHQDQWYWPLDTDRTITMWLPLHDLDPAMGELEFALGTHTGPLADVPISAASDDVYERHLSARSIARRRTGAMAAGDASFHLGWALHRAVANSTAVDREVMTVIWFADGARATEPSTTGQATDLRMWLPGVRPGELAASPLNPVLG